jgi:hypothetical protein
MELLSKVFHAHTILDELVHKISIPNHLDALDTSVYYQDYPKGELILSALSHNLVGKYMRSEMNTLIIYNINNCSSRSSLNAIIWYISSYLASRVNITSMGSSLDLGRP